MEARLRSKTKNEKKQVLQLEKKMEIDERVEWKWTRETSIGLFWPSTGFFYVFFWWWTLNSTTATVCPSLLSNGASNWFIVRFLSKRFPFCFFVFLNIFFFALHIVAGLGGFGRFLVSRFVFVVGLIFCSLQKVPPNLTQTSERDAVKRKTFFIFIGGIVDQLMGLALEKHCLLEKKKKTR